MQTKWIASVAMVFLISIFLMLSSVIAAPETVEIESSWLRNRVTLDGEMTTAQEWSDAVSVDLTLLEKHIGPATIPSRWWVKNDAEWLYLLARVPVAELEAYAAYIDYFWPYPYVGLWEHSDFGWVDQDDDTWDAYGWDEVRWYDDTLASPPGENNVEGAASKDGTYYWFEFRKALNSGDGYDWSWAPGETVGTGQTGDLLLGIYDKTVPTYFEEYILLHLASVPVPVGGVIVPVSKVELLAPWLGLAALMAAMIAAVVVRRRA